MNKIEEESLRRKQTNLFNESNKYVLFT